MDLTLSVVLSNSFHIALKEQRLVSLRKGDYLWCKALTKIWSKITKVPQMLARCFTSNPNQPPLPESVCVDLRSDYIKSPPTPPNQPRIRPHTFCVDFRSGSRTGPSHGELCRDFSWKLVGYRLLLMSFYFHLISERFVVHPTEYK